MGLIRGSEGAGGVGAPLRKSIRGMIDAISKEACPGSAPARFTGSRAGTTARVSAKNNPAAASRVSAIAPPEDRIGVVVCFLSRQDLGLRSLVQTGLQAIYPKWTCSSSSFVGGGSCFLSLFMAKTG